MALFAIGLSYCADQLMGDVSNTQEVTHWLLLFELPNAHGFEFVNGFTDTANAVADFIYIHSLTPHKAVVWSGLWNLLGPIMAFGTVA